MSMELEMERSPSGFLRSRVVQVHPTLRCNLRCAHCYSSSSPGTAPGIPPRDLIWRLARLRAEGYEVVSFSGGEPLMYHGLRQVARAARDLGFRINLITNGLLLSARRADELADLVSLVGVSIDGPASIHDRLRGSGTYERTIDRLRHLRERNVAFGIVHCVTQTSLTEHPALLDLCMDVGAKLFQLHPLTMEGRASEECIDDQLSAADMTRLFLLAELFKIQVAGTLHVQLDLSPIEHILASRGKYSALRDDTPTDARLADLVNPVVIDEHGHLWPLAYGIASDQRIGAGEETQWSDDLDAYLLGGAQPLAELLESGVQELKVRRDGFVDWYAFIVHHSHMRNGGAPGNELMEGQQG